jgi:hypothetical protein
MKSRKQTLLGLVYFSVLKELKFFYLLKIKTRQLQDIK